MLSALFLSAMKALCGVLSRQHIVRSELDAIPEPFVIDGWDVHTFPVERSFFHICNKSIGLLRYNEHKTPFLVLFTLLLQCRLYPANIPICVAVTDRAAHIKRGFFRELFLHLYDPGVDTGDCIFYDASADLSILGKTGQHDCIDLFAPLPSAVRTAAVMGSQHVGQGYDPFVFALAALNSSVVLNYF